MTYPSPAFLSAGFAYALTLSRNRGYRKVCRKGSSEGILLSRRATSCYSPRIREGGFSETRIPNAEYLVVRTGAKAHYFALRRSYGACSLIHECMGMHSRADTPISGQVEEEGLDVVVTVGGKVCRPWTPYPRAPLPPGPSRLNTGRPASA